MVFILGMGVLALGVILMIWTRIKNPEFFRGTILSKVHSLSDGEFAAEDNAADQPAGALFAERILPAVDPDDPDMTLWTLNPDTTTQSPTGDSIVKEKR